jgi:hypothetical protein
MTEWGVFNDEGCVERGLWSAEEAGLAVILHRKAGDEHAEAKEMCSDHEEQPKYYCEECFGDD